MQKLEVTLKQHTPLIHFQHDQEGATLRATEVKPKLDRFILTKLGETNQNKTFVQEKCSVEYERVLEKTKEKSPNQVDIDNYDYGHIFANNKGWIRAKGALDYKMRFEVEENPQIFNNNEVQKDRQGNIQTSTRKDGRTIKRLRPYPLFFANLNADIDDPTEYKCFSFLKKTFKIKLLTTPTKSDLLEEIGKEKRLANFFQYHNFGTRQSKGFGAFYIDKSDVEQHKEIELKYRYSIDIRSQNRKWLDLFESIDLFYKSLRSGINICWGNKFYMKPAIFQYAKQRGLDWDKKLIKQSLLDRNNITIGNDYLFKDLLGLSTEERWMSYSTNISKENAEIERFPSPIIIKPINEGDYFNVFIDSNPSIKKSFNDFLNKRICISSSIRNGAPITLTTYPRFDIDDFLSFALLENELSDMTKDLKHDNYIELLDIYNEIKREHL
jgi:hypothetical protein